MKAKLFFLETRPQFLLLAVILGILGISMAWYDGHFNLVEAIIATVGLILVHAACNIFNDYFDYRSGVDKVVNRTPFSGGSGLIKSGLLTSKQVLWLGIVLFVLAVPIGVYFVLTKGWLLLPVILIAAFCVILYSPVILKMWWPEWSPMVGLGVLPVLGMYFSQTGVYTDNAILASIPSGFLVHNLLLINEFPDIEADKVGKRKTLPITIGGFASAVVYTVFTIATYIWIAVAVVFKVMPVFCLLALLTLPLAIKAMRGSFHYKEMDKIVPAMATNVLVVLLTQLLTAIGYFVSGALKL
jgi:1,4-dihydroxy-2-naphthoate polyprenyltransferase